MKRIWAIFIALFAVLFGVPASHAVLYFPHVDTTPNQWQTEICVINPSSTDTVQGNLESYSNAGSIVATKPLSVGPNSRKQIDVGAELANAGTTGYIVFQNASGSPVGYTKFAQSGGDRVAIPAVDSVSTGNLYVTHIAWVPWWTGISLVNTTSAAKTLTIRFNTGQIKTVTLAPKEHRAFTIAQLFDNLIDTEIISAVIENAGGIVGLELFGNLPGLGKQLGGVPLISKTATTLFYPHVDSTPGQWWTGIVAYNPSASTTAQMVVNSYATNGASLGSSPQPLVPGQKFIGVSTDLNLPAGTAWFSLQSQIPLVGFELFGRANSNSLAGYSVVDLERKSGVFPKVEKNGGWTGIAFVNTENQQATVTLKAYNDTGNVLGEWVKNLNAHEKLVNVAETLFPGINLNTATYLSFSADRNVAGFQLNGSGDTILDALPAQPAPLTSSSSGPQEIIDQVLGLFKYQSTVTSGMQTVRDIITQITSGAGTGGTCPQVISNPPEIDIFALPSAITITASYVNGCTATDGGTMSGQAVLAITNIAIADPNVSLDFALTATNLRRNGALVLNGSVSGHIAFTDGTANVSVHFNNFQAADSTISGDLTMTATNLDLSGEAVSITNMTISFSGLTAAGHTVNSGTLTVTNPGSNTIQMVANLNTDQGAVNMTLTVLTPSDTRIIVSTPTPATIAGYTVTLTNVTLDTSVCNGYPSNGSVTVSQGGESATETFTPSCPVVHRMNRVSPSHNSDPWLNFSVDLYKYLTIKR